MPDKLLELDIKTFDKSIENCISQLSKMEKNVERDIRRLTYEAGRIIANEAKLLEGKRVHKTKNSGMLARSIHCAASGVNHSSDQNNAASSDLMDSKGKEASAGKDSVDVEIGSWLDYSYYIEVGTKKAEAFPYLLPAYESKFEDVVDYIVKGLKTLIETGKK